MKQVYPAIAGACKISNSIVGDYLRRAKAAGVSWPLGEPSESEEKLDQKLFGDTRTCARNSQAASGLVGKRCEKSCAKRE
jgi:hypothetical protein